MIRTGRLPVLPLAALGAFLLATALSLGKPGLPSSLRGGEAAYWLQSASLALDGDLALEAVDVERLFATFPYGGAVRVPVRAAGPEAAPIPEPPILYALLAAPWLAVLGANGPLALNMLLAVVAIAGLAACLLRTIPDGAATNAAISPGTALSTAILLLGLSAISPYLLHYHPAALLTALGALLALALAETGRRTALDVAGGGSWALLVWMLPAALALLPALLVRVRRVSARSARSWTLGALGGAVLALGLAFVAGQPPFEAGARLEILIEHPDAFLQAGREPAAAIESLRAPMPELLAADAREGLGGVLRDAFLERRRGFLPYYPLVLLALLGAAFGWRRGETWHWLLLAGLGGAVVFRAAARDPRVYDPLLGGELLGDPSLAALYPLFFLVMPALPPLSLRLGAYALATFLLGGALVASLGPVAAYGDPQAHTRGGLLARLPLSIENVGRAGIYRPTPLGGPQALDARLWWPAYAAEVDGDEIWVLGGERVTLYLSTAEPLDAPSVWRVRNLAPGNVVNLRYLDQSRRDAFPDQLPPGGQGAEVEWSAASGREVLALSGETRYVYPLEVETRRGFRPSWRGGVPKPFYLGAALSFLGPRSHMERDVYAAETLGCGAPPSLETGEEFPALVRLRNASAETWNAAGAVRTRLAHRWRRSEGDETIDGPRLDPGAALAPGAVWSTWMPARAPSTAGSYRLVVDLVYENVAYFEDRAGAPLCEMAVDVTAGDVTAGDGR